MGDDPESEGNLEEAFQLAMEEYTRRTGIRIKDEHPQTVEEMRRQMVKFGTGGMHAQGVEAAKTTMDFFVRVGEIGADAGSAAWPPAAVCFKATQLVIETAQNYRKNFTIKGVQESLDSILTVVNDVARYVEGSKRGAQLDAELQNIVLRRLAHFLNVCAIYTKVQKDSRTVLGSVKNVFKSVAGNDGGLQNELSQIEGLQKREEHVLGAKVFINTSITGNFLELQNRDTAKNRRRVAVKKILGFDEKNSAWNSWNDMHSNLKKGLVEKTGTWLLQDDFFRAWVDTEKALAKPVLALKGPTGTGKSHLCYSVVDHLYREYQGQMQAAGQTWQASIAYFYFERLEKGQSKSKDKRETSIRDALAALIWQITENDVAYQNFVSDQRISPSGFSTDDLWDNLITKFSESIGSKRRKVFFLVLDGVDQAKDEDIARTLSSLIEKATQLEKSNFQVRFFFTGTEKVFNGVSSTADESIEMIGVPERNREDIHLFIRTRIDKFRQSWKIGKDQDDLLDKLEAKLKDQSSDNFHEAISSLEEIRETKGSHELKEILNREAGDRSAAAAWQLKRLNRNLTEEEIVEFNDILVCMVLMTVWPTVQQLETFRLLRGASRDSIRLGTQIQEKYSQFFDVWDPSDSIDDKNRFVRSKATLDYFMELEGERSDGGGLSVYLRKSAQANTQKPGAIEDRLQTFEIEAVERLIRSVCGEELFKRFQFAQYFGRLRDQQEAQRQSIQFDRMDGHMKMALCLLKAVCSPERDDYECLHHYAATDLYVHLDNIKPDYLERSDSGTREDIGRFLFEFFWTEDNVRAWLTKGSLDTMRSDGWDRWQEYTDTVLLWFKDPVVGRVARKQLKDHPEGHVEEPPKEQSTEAPEETLEDHFSEHSGNHPGYETGGKTGSKGETPAEELIAAESGAEAEPAAEESTEKQPQVLTGEAVEQPPVHVEQETDKRTEPQLVESPTGGPTEELDKQHSTTESDKKDDGSPATAPLEESEKTVEKVTEDLAEGSVEEKEKEPDFTKEALMSVHLRVLASRWLQDDEWDAADSLQYLLFFTDEYSSESIETLENRDRPLRSLKLIQDAEALALKLLRMDANGDQSPMRHVRVGETCLHYALYDESIERCLKIQDDWKARWCLTRAYQQTEQNESALETLDGNLNQLKDRDFQTKHETVWNDMVETLWNLYNVLKHHEKAIETFRELQDIFKEDTGIMNKVLQWAYNTDGSDELKTFLKNKYAPPVDLFLHCADSADFHHNVSIALQDDLGGIIKGYVDAITSAKDDISKRTHLRFYYGQALFYQQRVREALIAWEDNVAETDSLLQEYHDQDTSVFKIREKTVEKLVSVYIQLSKKADSSEFQKLEYARKTEDLCRWNSNALQSTDHTITLSLARIHYLTGRKYQARECIKDQIERALRFLSDEIPNNDWQGYWWLCQALMLVGDDDNARAAWSLITKDDLPKIQCCSGSCEDEPYLWDEKETYVCRDCVDVKFEKTCWKKLQEGKLEKRLCGKDHDFLILPKPDEKMAKDGIDKKIVQTGGTEKSIEDWLNVIRRNYDVEVSGVQEVKETQQISHGFTKSRIRWLRK